MNWDDKNWKTAAREYHPARGNRTLIVELEPERLAQLRRLMADNISLDRTWAELNQRQRVDAPQATVEALMFSLRSGVAALSTPDTQRRLSELDLEQVREVCGRVQNFKQHIAPPWTEADVGLLIELAIELRKAARG